MTRCQPCADQTSKSGKIWRTNAKQKAVDYLGGSCQDCGFKTDILAVYDFHHRDPAEKDFTVAKFINADFDLVVTPELNKCDLLCSNCHRIRHATNPSFEEIVEEIA
jgi:predicted HNH restriction endonuclease